ncbi:MAG: cyclic lactone autoinducer peptide [Ruminococcus sp.]|nr:cyclic lactone autoinducer peptide [Ruminococcus sp.]
MKNTETKKKALSGAAAITKKSAFIFGSLNCGWWDYQPKTPKAVKKQNKV